MPPTLPKLGKQRIPIPGTNRFLNLTVEAVPADKMPSSLKNVTNVAKVNIAGKPFFLVAGKTTVSL